MVKAAVTDVVAPAVAAEDPHALLGEEVVHVPQFMGQGAVKAFQVGHDHFAKLAGAFGVVLVVQPTLKGFLQFGRSGFVLEGFLNLHGQQATALFVGNAHAAAVFGGVFKQRVAPGRAKAVLVGAVRRGGRRSAPDGRAARGVGHDHAFAEHLGEHLDVRRFTATSAGAGELVQGLLQLRTLDGVTRHEFVLQGNVGIGVGQVFLLGSQLGVQGLHDQSLDLGGAHFGARAAAQAVFSVHLNAELQTLEFLADGVLGGKGSGSASQFCFGGEHGANGGVGAHKGALAALDAVFNLPFGHVDGAAALFASGGAKGHEASRIHGGHGQLVALLGQNGTHNGADVIVIVAVAGFGAFGGSGPRSGVFHFFQSVHALVHSGNVHVDDLVALAAVGLLDGFLEQAHGLFKVKHVGKLEEGGLHDHVDAAAEAHFLGNLDGVHVVELQLFAGDNALHGGGQVLFHVGERPVGVQHKGAAFLDAFKNVVLGHVGSLVTGNVVGLGDQVRRGDLFLAEAQVRHGKAARLLGVVSKVGLGVEIGVVADDLDGLLVGAHGAVSAEAEELALHGAGGHGVNFFFHVKRGVGDVVVDAHGEVVLGLKGHHVVVHGLGHAGGEVLGAQAVAAAHQGGSFALFEEGSANVLIQGFAKSAAFLGAVEHGDAGHAGRQGAQQMFGGEGTEQVHLHKAHALALSIEVLDCFFDNLT